VQLPSRFTHDIVRHGSSVYVCDTGNGRVLQLAFPEMKPVRVPHLNRTRCTAPAPVMVLLLLPLLLQSLLLLLLLPLVHD